MMKETTMKISALAALIAVLSTFSASAVQAGGAPTGVNWHSGGDAAANGQSQGQKGGAVRYAGGRVGGGGDV
jgi:hypothetical protein